ncbi:MAG: mechanosensitive ion channel family protein [Chitinophagales bacterium]|nr:mechanosensitive ion channel family protein [Bacteroidota bacterium]
MDSVQKLEDAFLSTWNHFITNLPDYLLAIVVMVVGVFLSYQIAKVSSRLFQRTSRDPLVANFLTNTIRYIFLLIVFLFALKIAGLDGIASGIFAAAGASAVVIGFAFKDIGENFFSGVILSFNRPFDVEDTVKIGDIFGKVKTMEFRYTKIKTFDGRDVYVPNSDIIKTPVYNYTEDGYFRMDFSIGIPYSEDMDGVEKLMVETVKNADGVIDDEEHEVFSAIEGISGGAMTIKVFFWVNTYEYRKHSLKIKGDVINEVKKALDQNGIKTT